MKKSPELQSLVEALGALAATMTGIIDTRIGEAVDLYGARLLDSTLHHFLAV